MNSIPNQQCERPLDAAALFRPRAVMLVGASHDPQKPGGAILRHLTQTNPQFGVYAVNPERLDAPGCRWSPSIEAVPEPCELAIVAVPAAKVPDILTSLGAKGTRIAIVISAGMTESSGLRQRALDAASAAGLRILGPNCIGALIPRIGLNASFAADGARAGNLAFLSQSGALVAAVLDWADERRIGFSAVVSMGDMADVGLAEMITLLGDDDQTSAILIYLEGLTDARPFLSAVRALLGRKPVIVLKAGHGKDAARAALSHTGALAGSYDIYCAAFRQHGIVVVETLEELFDAAAVLARCPIPAGDRLAIITNGGGAGILATDALDTVPGVLATLSAETIDRLDRALPPAWSHANPVDIIGDANGERYAAAIHAVIGDPQADALLVINCPTAICDAREIVAATTTAVKAAASGKPVLACWLGDTNARNAEQDLADAGVALLETPDDAVRGFSYLLQARPRVRAAAIGREVAEDTLEEARRILAQARSGQRTILNELDAKALLALFGIPVVHTIRALTPDDVAEACSGIDPPYAVKIVSPDLTHKSDLGGVALGLTDAAAAKSAAESMLLHLRSAQPAARLEGFAVQPMIRRKQAHELLCGIVNDPAFGPVMMVGAGGTAVEVIADRALRLPPIDRGEAEAMLLETRISRLLAGYRDVPPARRDAIIDVLLSLSDMIGLLPEIAELDINPLLADPAGVIALDARVVLN